MKVLLLLVVLSTIPSCAQDLHKILSAATHACGTIYLDGYATDSEAKVKVAKVPDGEDPNTFCVEE